MHPMFVKLFLETDEDALLAEDKAKRRAANRARRARSRVVTRAAPVDRDRRPRR